MTPRTLPYVNVEPKRAAGVLSPEGQQLMAAAMLALLRGSIDRAAYDRVLAGVR